MSYMALSMLMVMYIAHYRPFQEDKSNSKELLNEVCGFFVIYFLMWLSVFPPMDVSEINTIKNIGWGYIGAVSFNIVLNFLILGWSGVANFQ